MNPNTRDDHTGENSLSHAAYKGNLKNVKLLHENGAKLFTDEATSNPLICAAHSENTELITYLMELGLDPEQNYSDPGDPVWSPLVMARINGLMNSHDAMVDWLANGNDVKAHAIKKRVYEEALKHSADTRPKSD